MVGIVPELTHGVPCPGRGSFCSGNVKIDHRAWIYGCCHQSCSFGLSYAPNRLSAGALPQTPLGELVALPRPISFFRGWGPREREGEGGEKKGGRGKEERESRNAQIQSWQA